MNGPEHYQEAERLLQLAVTEAVVPPKMTWALEAAQAHATLALVGMLGNLSISDDTKYSVAAPPTILRRDEDGHREWFGAWQEVLR